MSIAQCVPCTILSAQTAPPPKALNPTFGIEELEAIPTLAICKLLKHLFDQQALERLGYLLASGDIDAICELGERIRYFGVETMEPSINMLGEYMIVQANDFRLDEIETILTFLINQCNQRTSKLERIK